jgi:hypothetical protein
MRSTAPVHEPVKAVAMNWYVAVSVELLYVAVNVKFQNGSPVQANHCTTLYAPVKAVAM